MKTTKDIKFFRNYEDKMVALDQVKYELNQYTAPLKEVGESLDLEKKSFRSVLKT